MRKKTRKRNDLRKPSKVVRKVGKTALAFGTAGIAIGLGKGMIKGAKK